MKDLTKKINQIKDDHAAEIVEERDADYSARKEREALFFLGRVKQNDHIAVAISTNLTAQTIRALEAFQEEAMYKQLGYQTFVDFLEKSEFSPMSKRQYYERRELMNAHGDEVYDLLTSVGISVRSQKLLGTGDLKIEGDRLMIGDTEVEVANTGVIKEVLNELFDERRELQATVAKKDKKIEDQSQQLDRGQAEFDELQRNFDSMNDGDPFDRTLANAIHAMLLLQEATGHLDDKVKARRGPLVLRDLQQQLNNLQRSFGVTDLDAGDSPARPSAGDDLVSRVLSESEEEDAE